MKCPKCDTVNPETARFCLNCATPIPSSEDIPARTETMEAPKEELTTGSTFAGRYQIIEELGKGGMGRVYRVLDKELKEEVALKLIKPEIAKDKKTIERFKNELKVARKISHRHVGRMYELMEDRGTHFITMEYVPGQDLRGLIKQMGQLTTGKAIAIATEICEGLNEAHRQGVVHRDLKPSNIIIDRQGNARILDFGIARSVEGKGITGAGVMIGTPEYMSPEQVEGKETDQRSDIYSLGIILYEMVTGRVPFEGDTPFTVGVKHKSEIPKDPKELNSQIHEDLSRVILRCLEKEKEKRYQNAGEVSSELTNIEKGIPTTERVVPERKPLTSREITVTFGLKKLWIPAAIIIGIAILAVAAWQILGKREPVPSLSGKPSFAVMYFENNTGDSELDHYKKAISDLLITDLGQSKYLRVLSGAQLFNILSQLDQLEAKSYSSEVLKQVASRGGVEHIISGSYTKAGDTYRINYTLLDASSAELLGSEQVEGRGEESIFSMVDELTRKIKANLRLSENAIAGDIDKSVGSITTNSPEALRYYIEGRKYFSTREHRKNIEFMEKAVSVDPEFAMAYRSMAISYGELGFYSKGIEFMEKALEFSERMSDRERYLIQGDFYRQREETYGEAIEAYQKLLELYPDDMTGNNNLGVLYADIEEWDKAIEAYEVNKRNGDQNVITYTNLAGNYAAKGMYEKAKEYLEEYINTVSDNSFVRRSFAQHYIYQGKLDLALAEIEKALSFDPDYYANIRRKGDIYLYKGDLVEAEKLYRRLFELKEPRAHYNGWTRLASLCLIKGKIEEAIEYTTKALTWAEEMGEIVSQASQHRRLSYLHHINGNHEKALKEIDAMLETASSANLSGYKRRSFMSRGIIYVGAGLLDKAIQEADELKKRVDAGMNKKQIRNYYYLMGMIELERENFEKAIEYIQRGLPMEPGGDLGKPAWALETLALAYYKSGELKNALVEYEWITKLTNTRFAFGLIYAKSFYMLGKIYEQQGNSTEAIEHYEKFLDLWKDADPGMDEVEDAKKRLDALRHKPTIDSLLVHVIKPGELF